VDILSNVLFRDGAWFYLNGCLNRTFGCGVVKLHVPIKNCPYIIQKIGTRCPLYRRRVVGSLVFEDTVDGNIYRDIITQLTSLQEVDDCD
jgi:hypothetical protein